MDTDTTCPNCGRELTGAMEAASTVEGDYVFIVKRETSDCNWTTCGGCQTVICKPCREARPTYCCDEGRVIDHERARMSLVSSNTNQNATKQEEEICLITRSST